MTKWMLSTHLNEAANLIAAGAKIIDQFVAADRSAMEAQKIAGAKLIEAETSRRIKS